VQTAEIVALRDSFGHHRLKEGKYTPGRLIPAGTKDIEDDFSKWLDQNPNKLICTGLK
jgi:hypothetical protein